MRSWTLCVLCLRRLDDAERRDGIPTGDRGNEGTGASDYWMAVCADLLGMNSFGAGLMTPPLARPKVFRGQAGLVERPAGRRSGKVWRPLPQQPKPLSKPSQETQATTTAVLCHSRRVSSSLNLTAGNTDGADGRMEEPGMEIDRTPCGPWFKVFSTKEDRAGLCSGSVNAVSVPTRLFTTA